MEIIITPIKLFRIRRIGHKNISIGLKTAKEETHAIHPIIEKAVRRIDVGRVRSKTIENS